MGTKELIESLERCRQAIGTETVQTIDFDRLEEDLGQAVETLGSLRKKQELCDQLLSDFKSEIKRMALAVSRTKGEARLCDLVERLISSPDLRLDDLFFLREQVREEFDQCFPATPQSKVATSRADRQSTVSEFKTGREDRRG